MAAGGDLTEHVTAISCDEGSRGAVVHRDDHGGGAAGRADLADDLFRFGEAFAAAAVRGRHREAKESLSLQGLYLLARERPAAVHFDGGGGDDFFDDALQCCVPSQASQTGQAILLRICWYPQAGRINPDCGDGRPTGR